MSVFFGDFELDQERQQLLRSGRPVPLEPKAYAVLSRSGRRERRDAEGELDALVVFRSFPFDGSTQGGRVAGR